MVLALSACSKPTHAGPAREADRTARPTPKAGDDAPYATDLPMSEFMPHVMQYAGDAIWKRQGYVNDKTGLHSLYPKNDREWEDAESGARTLAEITNVLLIPGRRVSDPRWDSAVLAVRAVALRAADAAERHDEDAFFAAGGDLDEACDACHLKFDPNVIPRKP